MNEPTPAFTPAERRALLVMARWAAESRYKRLYWSIPNDASWAATHLAGIAVRHNGMPDQYDLVGRRGLGGLSRECTVATMWRTDGTPRVRGVPEEEWLRPSNQTAEREPDPGGTAPAAMVHAPRRPQVRLTAAALALILPAGAIGVTLASREATPPVTPPARTQAPPVTAAPLPPMPPGATDWAGQARVRLASMDRHLDTLATAEKAWSAVAPPAPGVAAPEPIHRLQDVWASLAAQRAQLAAQLTEWEELAQARETLADAEQRLAEVRSGAALAATDAAKRLQTEAARLARQADRARQQVQTHSEQVSTVAAQPLPESPAVEPVADAVLALAQNPPPSPPEPNIDVPVIASGREPEPVAPQEQPDDDPEPDGDEPDDETGPPERAGDVHVTAPGVEVDVEKSGVDVTVPGVAVSVGADDPAPERKPEKVDKPESEPVAEAPVVIDVEPVEPAPQPRPAPDPVTEPEPEPVPAPEPVTMSDLDTPDEQQAFRDQVETAADRIVAEHADEWRAAAEQMEGLTLEGALTREGETPQQMRDRLTAAAEAYRDAMGR